MTLLKKIVPKLFNSESAMITCLKCGKKPAGASFALCAECLREYPDIDKIIQLHRRARVMYNLPPIPPKGLKAYPVLSVLITADWL